MIDFIKAGQENAAKAYGFLTQKVEGAVAEWIKSKVTQGSLVGVWDGSFKLYADPKQCQERLQPLANAGVTIQPIIQVPFIDNFWKCLDYFSEGEIDYFICEDWYCEFPKQGRTILNAISDVALKREQLLQKSNGEENAAIQEIDIPDFSAQQDSPFMKNHWGKLLSFAGRFSEAGEVFRKIIETHPEYGEPYSNMGTLLWNFGKRREAFVMFVEALLKNPHRTSSQLNFLDAGYELEEYENMMNVIQEIIPTVPECVEFKHHLAICYHRFGQTEKAETLLNEILAGDPQDADAKNLLQEMKNAPNQPTAGT